MADLPNISPDLISALRRVHKAKRRLERYDRYSRHEIYKLRLAIIAMNKAPGTEEKELAEAYLDAVTREVKELNEQLQSTLARVESAMQALNGRED